jgi:hypothetical protein
MGLRVECYAGYRGEETPRALVIGEGRITVIEILDRWLAPGGVLSSAARRSSAPAPQRCSKILE